MGDGIMIRGPDTITITTTQQALKGFSSRIEEERERSFLRAFTSGLWMVLLLFGLG